MYFPKCVNKKMRIAKKYLLFSGLGRKKVGLARVRIAKKNHSSLLHGPEPSRRHPMSTMVRNEFASEVARLRPPSFLGFALHVSGYRAASGLQGVKKSG